MTVGVLVVTHENLARVLVDTTRSILGGELPLPVGVMSVDRDAEPIVMRQRLTQQINALDRGKGVLVLVDIFGSTPGNVACSLIEDERIEVVAGVNLPMLVRVMNYAELELSDLVRKAVTGGHDGVFLCRNLND